MQPPIVQPNCGSLCFTTQDLIGLLRSPGGLPQVGGSAGCWTHSPGFLADQFGPRRSHLRGTAILKTWCLEPPFWTCTAVVLQPLLPFWASSGCLAACGHAAWAPWAILTPWSKACCSFELFSLAVRQQEHWFSPLLYPFAAWSESRLGHGGSGRHPGTGRAPTPHVGG